MLQIKYAQFGPRPDFTDNRVKRLQGRLAEIQSHAEECLERISTWASDEKWDITLEYAWHELKYNLDAMRLRIEDINY